VHAEVVEELEVEEVWHSVGGIIETTNSRISTTVASRSLGESFA
jgi:hypothetical protein